MAVFSFRVRRICRGICDISYYLIRMRSPEQLFVFVLRSMERKTISRLILLEIYNVQHILQPRFHDEAGTYSAAGAFVRMECGDMQPRRLMPERPDQLLSERVGYLQEEAGLVFHGCRHICPDGSYMTCQQQKGAAERGHMQSGPRS